MSDPGKRDQRVIVQSVPITKSASGADVKGTPVQIARTWAEIKTAPRSQTEFFTGEKLTTRTTYQVEIPYIPNLTEAMEIVWEARNTVLDIIKVEDLGPRELTIKILVQDQR